MVFYRLVFDSELIGWSIKMLVIEHTNFVVWSISHVILVTAARLLIIILISAIFFTFAFFFIIVLDAELAPSSKLAVLVENKQRRVLEMVQ